MPSLIRSNSPEVSRSRPVLGFTIHTGGPPWFEVALASDPSLFSPEQKDRRTPSTFYSSRALGPLPAERGEAVWLVPPSVLARFVGQDQLYYTIATSSDPTFRQPELSRLPSGAVPSVAISKSFSGDLRRLAGVPNTRGGLLGNGYGSSSPESLEWAGDVAAPGTSEPVTPPGGAGGTTPSQQPAGDGAAAMAYDDGLGYLEPMPPTKEQTGGPAHRPEVPIDEADADAERCGIDGPLPEDGAAATTLAEESPEYPKAARLVLAAPGNYEVPKKPRTVDRIVIHITDPQVAAGANVEGAVAWFRNPASKVSAHYVVGQDGEVVQMVRHADIAYHARGANTRSIGIEHVAKAANPKDATVIPLTAAQYASSAELVRWLCDEFGLPADRTHIVGHAEIGQTSHKGCPDAVWDWNTYLPLVAAAPSSTPATVQSAGTVWGTSPLSSGTGGAQSFDIDWPDVQVVPQPTDASCWATAAAIVTGWRDQQSIRPEDVARMAGRGTEAGIMPAERAVLAEVFGLVTEPPQSYTVEGFRQLLEKNGPLWVGVVAAPPLAAHAVVVTGMWSDGNPDGSGTCVRIVDPWDRDPGHSCAPGPYRSTHLAGSRYTMRWMDFVREYEDRVTSTGGRVNIQVTHAGGTSGRTIGGSSAAPLGTALGGAVWVKLAELIGGTLLEAAVTNTGDLKWELQRLTNFQHPRGRADLAGPAVYSTREINIKSPVREVTWNGGLSYNDLWIGLKLTFDYNGRSVGNIRMYEAGGEDAPGGGVTVKGEIGADQNIYIPSRVSNVRLDDTSPSDPFPGPSFEDAVRAGGEVQELTGGMRVVKAYTPSVDDNGVAAIPVTLLFTYDYKVSDHSTYLIKLTLFGDGGYTRTDEWLQE
jgi:N-acetyl-anhydromuramyl-L-alanine amidase AmpD